jgi:hypothetical protein
MPSRLFKSVAILLLTFIISQTASAQFSKNPKLGINVGDLGKLTSSIPFVDIFKMSKGWYTSCEFDWRAGQPIDPGCTRKTSLNTREQNLLHLDGNGWVRDLPLPEDDPVFTSVTSIWKLSSHFPTGRYVVLYEGEGTMKITGDIRMVGQYPGHIEFDLLSPRRNLKLQITRTDPRRNGRYIRNIRIVPKKYEKDRRVFNPDYLARIRPMHTIRFMPWTNPRANEAVEWNERIGIGSAHYTGDKGVPAERMVDLANAVNAAPWLSIPYKASDDYMRQYARMVKNRLRKKQIVYVEFSNEVWNVIFPSATYAARKADKLWNFPYKNVKGIKRRFLLAANWYAKRSVEMCQIWKKEFGGQRNRVKCVVGTLFSVPWLGKEILDCPLWKQANGCGRHIDAFGVGPYFGDYIAKKENRSTVKSWLRDSDGGLSRLFAEIMEGGQIRNGPKGGAMSVMKDFMYANKKNADKYGLPMVAYEAGQHLIRYDPPHTVKDPDVLNLFMRAQKDPRMKAAYDKYLHTWASNGGGVMLHFYGIGEPEPKNFFGMLEYLQQPSTPKYAALLDYLNTPNTYVPPRRTYSPPPVQAPVARAPAVQQPVAAQRPQTTPQRTPQRNHNAPAQIAYGAITGRGVTGWVIGGNTAKSPILSLKPGVNHKLSIHWEYKNQQQARNPYFRIYAIDHKGGRKLLYGQNAQDIAYYGKDPQIYEEDINRYVGPPIQLYLETSPGLQVIVERVSY